MSDKPQAINYEPQTITLKLIRELATATAPKRPREIRDKSNHLILRHQPSGYLGLYVELGRGKRERLCNARDITDPGHTLTMKMVKARAASIRVQAADGRNFKAERDNAAATPTLTEYLDGAYAAWVRINRRSGEATIARIKSAFEGFLAYRLDTITPDKLEPWKARRLKKVRRETVNRDIAALRAALTRAEILYRKNFAFENPLADVEMLPVDKHRQPVRALTAEEKGDLVATLTARNDEKRAGRHRGNRWRVKRGIAEMPSIGKFADALTPAVIVSLETGLRRGELFALQWPSVDFRDKSLRVEGETAKSYETREIPLNKVALSTLRDWWLQLGQPDSGYVFSQDDTPIQDLKKSYHRVLADAGIERRNAKGESVNWHSLRHTFGSLLGAANVDGTTLMKLLGHANLSTTQRYLHTDEKRKRKAVKALEAM